MQHFILRAVALEKSDPERQLFGAGVHDWQHRPVDPAVLQSRVAVDIPDDLRTWLTEYGVGAGPFYGIAEVLPPQDGHLPLTDHGCGYSDSLRVETGEVWVDFGRGRQKWYDSVETWLEAWLSFAEAEWVSCYLQRGGGSRVEPEFLNRCLNAAQRAIDGAEDPMLQAYPLDHSKLWMGLAHGALTHKNITQAKHSFEQAAAKSRDPQAMHALGQIYLARHAKDPVAGLAAAEAGLKVQRLPWNLQGQFLRGKKEALHGLGRLEERDAMYALIADHFCNDIKANFDHAWVMLEHGDALAAARRLYSMAESGLACDKDLPLPMRLKEVTVELKAALQDAGVAERGAMLDQAILQVLPH